MDVTRSRGQRRVNNAAKALVVSTGGLSFAPVYVELAGNAKIELSARQIEFLSNLKRTPSVPCS